MIRLKELGYVLFAVSFRICSLFPRKKNRFFLVATHDSSGEGNIGIMARRIKRVKPDSDLCFYTRKDSIRHPIRFFAVLPYQLATASYVLLDNEFLPMAYLSFGKDVKVVQLWHGTGTIKKFGQDANTGRLYELERRCNRNLTDLIVSSEYFADIYQSAFHVPRETIRVLGLPRTDLFWNEAACEKRKQRFYQKFPDLKGKELILYAPTFRDDQLENQGMSFDYERVSSSLGKDQILLLRFHPFVAKAWKEKGLTLPDNILDVSGYEGISTLLLVADRLITDYSSVVFEYCLLKRPMIFYAYDLEHFSEQGRSFYEDYESFVPGPVVKKLEDLLEELKNPGKTSSYEGFIDQCYQYLDGKSGERVLRLLFSEE